MFFRAGQFRHQITIQVVTQTGPGDAGGIEETWGTHSVPYAKIVNMGGREFQGGGKVSGDTTHEFWFRQDVNLANITRLMRVSFGGIIYDITAAPRIIEPDRVWIVEAKQRD